MTVAEPIQITRLVAGIFEKLQIPYFVVGSLASSFHGIPRATADADLIADIKPKHVSPLLQNLQEEFYIDEERLLKAVQNHSSLNVIHLSTMFKIDIFILKDDPLSQEEMARREKYQVTDEAGQDLYIASAEDTILGKLQWYESAGAVSDRQWADVLGIMRVRSDSLDFDYLREAAGKKNLKDLLEKALNTAEISKNP